MAKFNHNQPYKIYKRTTLGVIAFEIHQKQPMSAPGGGGAIIAYEPVTTNPGNVKVTFPTLTEAETFIANKKSEGDGVEEIYDSEKSGG